MPGQMFGDYRILRLLGQGGMGKVFEAEQGETGRRVALKVMSHALSSEQDRKRFLREGRLAASVNHPNVVYIHGSEEIDGVPVITMELVHGGTINDRLKQKGPLPVADAVETALQLIDGLEAANNAGVLHRDIKPANCFVTAGGTVKVGDFGLSISTLARGESLLTATGSVLGTPAYASPEQLRGEELDARSDIYSVGATLYNLLTGATPFAATDFVKLITEVLDKQPAPPHALRREIPAELSKAIQRSLAKDRRARFQSYAELRDALLPFRAAEAVPANPAKRWLASLVDEMAAYAPSILFLAYWSVDPLESLAQERTLAAALVAAPFYLWYLLYYAVAEGLWGAALGKSLCGLRVAGPEGQAPGLSRALLRTAIFQMPYLLPAFLLMAFMPLAGLRAALAQQDLLITDWLWLPLLLSLFVTMRRRNGYAALHDLGSRTRVIVRPKMQTRPRLVKPAPAAATVDFASSPPAPAAASGRRARIGPYDILTSLWRRGDEDLLLASDPALRRQVWIYRRPLNAAPLSPELRDLSRAARLRWLGSGRTETQIWDAYDAVEGQPLLHGAVTPAAWNVLRFWLLDLAEELAFALKHPETTPTLALDRVWIANSGHLVLLDFPCPGLSADTAAQAGSTLDGLPAMQRFLDQVAQVALGQRPGAALTAAPVPLHARPFLASLAKGAIEKSEFIIGNLHSLAAKPAQVTRAWRAASLTLAPALMLGMGILLAGMLSFERIRWERAWNVAYPGKPSLPAVAELYVSSLEESPESNAFGRDAALTRAFLVRHFSDIITNDAAWTRPGLLDEIPEPTRFLLKQAVIGYPPPKSADLAEAARVLPERIERQERLTRLVPIWILLGSGIVLGLIFAFVELIGVFVFRQSPLLRLFGLALMDRSGQPATRLRLLWRWLLTWGVLGAAGFFAAGGVALAMAVGVFPVEGMGDVAARASSLAWILGLAVAGLALAAAISTLMHPSRGLQDRLAGTWVVPR
ncbi:MAG TPA: protein kinase [Verrucomicrobiales bacterium]|nr:protein kinase [Verrucomicrobiales bacterium]